MSENDQQMINIKKKKSSADRFNDWYMPHAAGILADWRARHPIKHHCEPLDPALHTNLPITFEPHEGI